METDSGREIDPTDTTYATDQVIDYLCVERLLEVGEVCLIRGELFEVMPFRKCCDDRVFLKSLQTGKHAWCWKLPWLNWNDEKVLEADPTAILRSKREKNEHNS